MSGCMRYRRKEVQVHLARQYALGLLSARVKKRTEALIKQDPELERIVYRWQGRLSSLIDSVSKEQPPGRVWDALQRSSSPKEVSPPWFSALWRYAGVASFIMLCAVSLILWQQPQQESTERVAGYLAVMNDPLQPQAAAFVLTAYQGAKPGQSTLKLQWEQKQIKQDLAQATLWTIERDTGKRLMIGQIAELIGNQFLTKDAWIKIKNSAELQITLGNQLLFQGPCLQLSPWQES